MDSGKSTCCTSSTSSQCNDKIFELIDDHFKNYCYNDHTESNEFAAVFKSVIETCGAPVSQIKSQDGVPLLSYFVSNMLSRFYYCKMCWVIDLGILRFLLQDKTAINQKDTDGFTPLCHAVSAILPTEYVREFEEWQYIFGMLIKNGADINYIDPNGDSYLHKIISSGDDDLCELFLKGGANPNAVDRDGRTLLQLANSRLKYLHDERQKEEAEFGESGGNTEFIKETENIVTLLKKYGAK